MKLLEAEERVGVAELTVKQAEENYELAQEVLSRSRKPNRGDECARGLEQRPDGLHGRSRRFQGSRGGTPEGNGGMRQMYWVSLLLLQESSLHC